MSNRQLERASAVLDALGHTDLGKPAPRPVSTAAPLDPRDHPRPWAPSLGVCHCGATVTFANLPSGKRAPLDKEPDGDLVIADGAAREYGPTHAGLTRYAMHFKLCHK